LWGLGKNSLNFCESENEGFTALIRRDEKGHEKEPCLRVPFSVTEADYALEPGSPIVNLVQDANVGNLLFDIFRPLPLFQSSEIIFDFVRFSGGRSNGKGGGDHSGGFGDHNL
jgi:hypothetical protein